ncbi:cyclase [Sphaerisporangium siamense]|uniref:Kynurenine formamidase n=1 Tax=Sphaerisporangium siamense TaxID=795645 RepID=A0A7W7DCV5_9ACTN|nr:cyclase family protein [Sphaerisporangium siamense]MBB4704504.1 kynurenine formamidase [Sphaerisporangium siamense]GII86116.1 cyclase [Sphaerisporangium siamense]
MSLWRHLGDAKVVDLAQPMRTGMPQSPNHPRFRMVIERRHGDMVREDGGSAANEVILTGGHVGTHVDALGHVSQDGYVHGGIEASGIQSHLGLSRHGIETFPPYVGRAVLLDVTAVHGVDVLPPGYEVTPGDLEAARRRAGVELRGGEAVLIGTGWSREWDRPARFTGEEGGVPGPGPDAARWLVGHGAAVVGGETIAFEHIPAGRGHATLPVHRILLVEAGVNIVETMRLTELIALGVPEFLLVLNPLPVVGATGAPVRPLAVLAA